jgi:hypothetical protein
MFASLCSTFSDEPTVIEEDDTNATMNILVSVHESLKNTKMIKTPTATPVMKTQISPLRVRALETGPQDRTYFFVAPSVPGSRLLPIHRGIYYIPPPPPYLAVSGFLMMLSAVCLELILLGYLLKVCLSDLSIID